MKVIAIRDPEAIRLIELRAEKENRSLSNSASTTIREALGRRNKNTGSQPESQAKKEVIL